MVAIKKVLKANRSAQYNFVKDFSYTAGLVLSGREVRDIKNLNFNIQDAFLRIQGNELYIDKFIIGNSDNLRMIKLLLNKREVHKILSTLKDRKYHGYLEEVFLTDKNLVKCTLCIGRIKRKIDKKADQRRSTNKRDLERMLKYEMFS